jgi:hypothetical protein
MRFNGFEEFQEYPKMLYDKDGATKVVAGPGEEQKAGSAWQFTSAGELAGAPSGETPGSSEVRRGRGRPPKAVEPIEEEE